jgi:hypothetical protein
MVFSDVCSGDADADNARDEIEKMLGTDPHIRDTDADGTEDGNDFDPLHDVKLLFASLNATGEGPAVTVAFSLGVRTAEVTLRPGSGATTLDLPEATTDRSTYVVDVLVAATDARTGEPVRLFPTGDQAVLEFDIVNSNVTAGGPSRPAGPITLTGADGSLWSEWAVLRE